MNYKKAIIQDYKSKFELYKDFSLLVSNLLRQFLLSKKIKFQLISHRAKDVEKLAVKIDLKRKEGKKYQVLSDIEDLSGVRVVFYLESHKEDFLGSFSQTFKRSILKLEPKYTQGGYRGTHIIFTLDESRTTLPEYNDYKDLKCEIQVTSVFYHAWSEVEHDIIYKPKGDADLLKTLGLDDLEKAFEKLMLNHIQSATLQLDNIYKKYTEILKAGEILGSDFVNDITTSETNDEMYEKLTVIEEFYRGKSEVILTIISAVLKKGYIKPQVISRLQDQNLYGKTDQDILLKVVDLLSNIRYQRPEEVLTLLSIFSLSKNPQIKERALHVVRKIAEYNLYILTETDIGYRVQRIILDFIKKWSIDKQLKHFNFIQVIAKEILCPSIEGRTSDSDTNDNEAIILQFGLLEPTPFISLIRSETIDLLYELYCITNDTQQHLSLIQTLNEITKISGHVPLKDDLRNMLLEESKYISNIYRKILFTEQQKINDLPIAHEIETSLYWLNKSEFRTNESTSLRLDIINNKQYSVFRVLVGESYLYRDEVGEDSLTEELEKLFKSINSHNLNDWTLTLNEIASTSKSIDDWKFASFKDLLSKLGQDRPAIAQKIIQGAITNSTPLGKKQFLGMLLQGLRCSDNFDIWDSFLHLIIRIKSRALTEALIFSLELTKEKDTSKSIRTTDISTIENIINKSNGFQFLQKLPNSDQLCYRLICTLSRNYECNPKRLEVLIIQTMKRYPKHTVMFLDRIAASIDVGWIKFASFSTKMIAFLTKKLIIVDILDWRMQQLLYEIGKKDFSILMDIFYQRLLKDKNNKLKTKEKYKAVPHELHTELQQFIFEHKDYPQYAAKWTLSMTQKSSIYNYHVQDLIQEIGIHSNDIIRSLMDRNDDYNLMNAARLLHSHNGCDFGMCMEIVRRTKNPKILAQVRLNMYSDGSRSGEYGLVDAYNSKAKELEKYLSDSNVSIRNFATQMIKAFKESAIKTQQYVDDARKLRSIDMQE